MRYAKVIVTSFNEGREVRLDASYPQHKQNVPNRGAILAMLGVVIEQERRIDPGVEMDTFIINNDCGFEEGNEFLRSIHESDTFTGKLYTYTRENIGGALGAFDWITMKKKKDYERWLLTEDDVLIGWPCYMAELELRFTASNLGFLATVGIVREHPLGKHAHGGLGYTSTEVLNKLGSVPYPRGAWDKKRYLAEGESRLIQVIENYGYEVDQYPLKDWNDKIHPYVR